MARWGVFPCLCACLQVCLISEVSSSKLDSRFKSNSTASADVPCNKTRLAVLIAGKASRLVWPSKVKHIVKANPECVQVDFYMRLLKAGNGNGAEFTHVPHQGMSMDWKDPESLLQGTTAKIIVKDIVDQNPDVAKDIPANHIHTRLSQYLLAPAESQRLVGMNTIARFAHTQTLFHSIMDHEKANGFRYDYVLHTRDDDHYIGPLKMPEDMSERTTREDADNKVFYKYCMFFGGINDKTLLFGRAAAEKVLARLYSDFWKPLPDEEQVEAPNPEIYLKRVIFARGASVRGVIWEDLPTTDAVYEDGPEGHRLCAKPAYWPCGHRDHPSLDKVVFCGAAEIGVIGNDHPMAALF
eukprot:TRINITY_DN5977_c0_g2_i1.p1 TRINITY_DN5977_c0_g2~~TRINITY_DN5977_c0_g2_i1.p1  ORF type:complete len:354 (+),score=58.35 TRINITY_DN5977_c0_g2_i1:44-1105(+)